MTWLNSNVQMLIRDLKLQLELSNQWPNEAQMSCSFLAAL